MGEIINLRRQKKRAARDQASRESEANRIRHGRTRAERLRDQEQNRRLNSVLDQHRRGEDQT
jgi:hypothetical protein